MKIIVNLTKEELDLLEEAVLQYQSLLIKTENPDQIVKNELRLCRRVVQEFGMENIEEGLTQDAGTTLPPGQFPYSR